MTSVANYVENKLKLTVTRRTYREVLELEDWIRLHYGEAVKPNR